MRAHAQGRMEQGRLPRSPPNYFSLFLNQLKERYEDVENLMRTVNAHAVGEQEIELCVLLKRTIAILFVKSSHSTKTVLYADSRSQVICHHVNPEGTVRVETEG